MKRAHPHVETSDGQFVMRWNARVERLSVGRLRSSRFPSGVTSSKSGVYSSGDSGRGKSSFGVPGRNRGESWVGADRHDVPEPTEDQKIDAEEFVARVLVQIPDPRRHLVRYITSAGSPGIRATASSSPCAGRRDTAASVHATASRQMGGWFRFPPG